MKKYQPDQPVKVVVPFADGKLVEQVARLDAKGQGRVGFDFEQNPGKLQVMVGHGDACSEELTRLQTLSFDLSTRQWRNKPELVLRPVVISPFLWFWWRRWCRTFTIRGRVICADGKPVPGAQVCASDVDWWFLWSSTQQVGCATTDINGNFRSLSAGAAAGGPGGGGAAAPGGWTPAWWSGSTRSSKDPAARSPPLLTDQPSLSIFKSMLSVDQQVTTRALTAADTGALDGLRSPLLKHLPASVELESLHVWPWCPGGPGGTAPPTSSSKSPRTA